MTNYIITLYNQKKFILISAENCVNGHDKIDINGHEKPAKPVI